MPLSMHPPKAYLNHAGASLMPPAVRQAMVDHLARDSLLGGYTAAAAMAPELDAVYTDSAQLMGCDADEVALTTGHASGWREVVGSMHFEAGDRILVARSEWGGNYAALTHIAQRTGARVEVIPCTADGTLCLTQLAQMMDARVRLISLTWLPANGGLIQPAQQVGALARAAGVPYVLDAAQALGQLPVDVRALGCDVLTAPGRKWLRGPRGTGLLYVRRDFMSQLKPRTVDQYTAPYRDGAYHLRADAKRFETSEACMAARLGLGVAIRQTLAMGVETIQAKVRERAECMRHALSAIEGVQLQDLGTERSPLVAFTVKGMPASVVRAHLMTHGVDVAVNGLSFTPLDMAARGLHDVVRASAHTDTRDEEIEALVTALTHLATKP
ncbi:aminotransferase class V-fold PLP-dependent enzyme [Limnohabitans sp. JirII-31]|uniref:aminotransferase class V-fold PLP-dependent enzyme n=1 Tax=Limnohabitans sp. JirII-31 TaxID=1977908 RepID=UPI000C1EBFD9|nr:aminotransferase class V-fold PLP-dependent enzyme [Limnohabitans sp. JirII-31]PIT72057.1 hypothetical protein B9Z41_16305 [Limnohabitans sp. JirII-31]